MSELRSRRLPLLGLASLCLALSACGSAMPDVSRSIVNKITPYKIDIVQGNVVTREQLALMKPGLSRNEVRDILGTPLLASVFHADRWDFAFTLRRQGQPYQSRKVTIFFKNDVLERTEADELPSEAEFVSTLKTDYVTGKAQKLEASEEDLRKFPPPKPVPPAAEAPAPVDYPPLESSTSR